MSAETVRRRLDDASEAVRAANHVRLDETTTAGHAYDVVGTLDELVHRIPQVVEHLAGALRRTDAAGYRDDRGHEPIRALFAVQDELRDARAALDVAGRHLATAHNHLGHLGRVMTED